MGQGFSTRFLLLTFPDLSNIIESPSLEHISTQCNKSGEMFELLLSYGDFSLVGKKPYLTQPFELRHFGVKVLIGWGY